jgi:hypothetical protein
LDMKPLSRDATTPRPASDRLDSWKEIATHLKREIRTVQRWEAQEGLPVHRHLHRRQGSVYAYKSELDAWWHNHTSAVTNKDDEGIETGGSSETLGQARAPASTSAAQALNQSVQPGSMFGRILRRPPFLALVPILFVIAVLVSVVVLASKHGWGKRATASVYLSGNRLVGLGTDGVPTWSYVLPRTPGSVDVAVVPHEFCGRGGTDALVAIHWTETETDDFDCFSESGKLLWKFQFRETLNFGGQQFGPPWHVNAWTIYRVGSEEKIAVALHHDLWWPGIIVALDAHGHSLQEFANAGWITDLHVVNYLNGPVLLAGGSTNSSDGSALAVLDANEFNGSSPELSGSSYECRNCPAGRPLKYFVFPRTEVNLATGSTKSFTDLDLSSGRLKCRTRETEGSGHFGAGEAIYGFSRDFKLVSAEFGDRYWDIHQELEKTGAIKHDKAHCPDRFGPRLVRMWDPKDGWRDLHPH